MQVPESVRRAWSLVGEPETVTGGWINQTLFVTTSDGAPLVLQRLHPIFAGAVNLDIDAITRHLEATGVNTPRIVPTEDAALFVEDEGVWRALTRLEGRTLDALDRPLARAAGQLVGRFHEALATMEHTFHFTRPGAHDTPKHLAKLRRLRTEASRPDVDPIADAILADAEALPPISAELPRRIIHGDLKATNILFHPDRGEALALVDLDTLAHGSLAVELGDALRSWCNPTSEADEHARFDASIFDAAMEGYASGAAGFAETAEVEAIVAGVETIALELASRFAADAYEDAYFGWDASRFSSRRAHNLARARAQRSLARSVRAQREHLEEMLRHHFSSGARP